MDKIETILKNKVSRRKFMAGIGAGVGATAAVSFAAGCGSDSTTAAATTAAPATTYTDLDIMNFALSLEYLGAEYYLNGLTGSGLTSSVALSGAGTVTGGAMVPGLAGSIYESLVAQLALDELGHVVALQAAITANGGTPVARPQIDFTDAYNSLAVAAGIGATFNPFDSVNDFLLGAFVFEDVDTSAYTGAAPLITSATVLDAAAGIQAVEAYHAAFIRTSLVSIDAASGTSLVAMSNKISTTRETLANDSNDTALSSSTIVNCYPTNGLVYGRTPSEVLHIVYGTAGGSGVAKGGFFPAGINGTITTTTA